MTDVTSAVQLPAVGTYRIDPSTSTITFTTRHLFGTGAVKGRFDLNPGDIIVAEPITASQVNATARTDSFTTGNPKRDKHVTSRQPTSCTPRPTPRSASDQPNSSATVPAGSCAAPSPPAATPPPLN